MTPLRRTLPALLLLAAAPAHATDPLPGVWRGTLGKQTVSACISDGLEPAYYYYHRHGASIALTPEGEPPARWVECDRNRGCDKPTGRWEVALKGADTLEGTWSDPEGKRTLPITLSRVKTGSQDPCEGEAYNAPRVDSQKLVREEAAAFGRKYRKVRLARPAPEQPEIESMELSGEGAGVETINQALRKELRANIIGYFTCQLGVIGGEHFASAKPLFWNDRFLAVSATAGGDCGGAHPSTSTTRTTWELASGREVNPWSWFKGARKPEADAKFDRWYFNYAAPEALNALIIAGVKPDDAGADCRGVLEENREYEVTPAAHGLRFWTVFPHVAQACDTDVEVPFHRLLPFLNEQGKALLEQLPGASDGAR